MARGAVREPTTAARLAHVAERRRRQFTDVRHPGRPELRVERVLVSPSGIHVVTSRDSSTEAHLDTTRSAAAVVADLLPVRYRSRVTPVLCRTDGLELAERVDAVLVTSPVTLEHILRSTPVVLSTSEVTDVALRLDAGLEPFPVVPLAARRPRRRRAVALAAAVTAGAAAAMAVLGPAVELSRLW
jgi:hypothetical protein